MNGSFKRIKNLPFTKPTEPSQTTRILVVDEEESTRRILHRYLTRHGYYINVCEDSECARQKLEQETYHVVLSDIVFPSGDGMEFIHWLRETHPHIDVVLITYQSSVELLRQAFKAGVVDYLTKPIQKLNQVRNTIQRHIDKRALEENLEEMVKELRVSQDNFSNIVDRSPDGTLIINTEKEIQYSNKMAQYYLGQELEILKETDFLQELLETQRTELQLPDFEDGRMLTLDVQLKPTVWQKQDAYLLLLRDISERKKVELQLRHDSSHDSLTHLANRTFFMSHLERLLARKKRDPSYMFAVLFLDLDRFKVINDSLGHLAGDDLLKTVAERLTLALREVDLVARLGGDEFAVLLDNIEIPGDAIRIANRILASLAKPCILQNQEVVVTTSIGITLCTSAEKQSEELMREADTAMYRAKSEGKNRHAIFDEEMHEEALVRLRMENDLRRAIRDKEFVLYYQPIIDLRTKDIKGFEALIRWIHPTKGFISPGDFIPLAEETGLIVQIGEIVLEEACHQLKRWQKVFPQYADMDMSVNVSAKQFFDSDWVDFVAKTLNTTGIAPKQLRLEITESVLMENPKRMNAQMHKIKQLGVGLHMDDFGTGYSSLSYLHQFPIDTLKIDRSFIKEIGTNKRIEIVRTIVSLASQLKMDVIAEGIETQQQLEWLEQLQCPFGQGYFFERPLSPKDARKYIQKKAAQIHNRKPTPINIPTVQQINT
ncbi:MAG: two-component system response regulator [Deltaproteobacteria bacterium]|nr:two-component system response regulator [Deltaproteobacteria bacterium]MBU50284.1 two-component system response regulator [Deltaproteobacteria bacterium]|tara:strand:- start:13451 stop:15598 length:2148 start_codon:yes stop_codon:yes gene_type:complete